MVSMAAHGANKGEHSYHVIVQAAHDCFQAHNAHDWLRHTAHMAACMHSSPSFPFPPIPTLGHGSRLESLAILISSLMPSGSSRLGAPEGSARKRATTA